MKINFNENNSFRYVSDDLPLIQKRKFRAFYRGGTFEYIIDQEDHVFVIGDGYIGATEEYFNLKEIPEL